MFLRNDDVPAKTVSENRLCDNCVYRSRWSLVRKRFLLVGLETSCTPHWVVTHTVLAALSWGIFHHFERVGVSISLPYLVSSVLVMADTLTLLNSIAGRLSGSEMSVI